MIENRKTPAQREHEDNRRWHQEQMEKDDAFRQQQENFFNFADVFSDQEDLIVRG